MFDHTAPLLVPGRMADRMTEARARRLAAEAAPAAGHTFWLTGGLSSAVHSGAALVARVRHVDVRPGSMLAPGHNRA